MLWAVAMVLVVPAGSGASAAAPLPPAPLSEWRAWEVHKTTIGEIVIHIQPVFDTTRPSEDNWLGRLANRIHVSTREIVIRRALLIKEGERVHGREIYETERVLRALPFIKAAQIKGEALGKDQVRLHVWVRDAWTLQGSANYQQIGGQRSFTLGLQDQNLEGTGKTLGFSLAKNHERMDSELLYADPQLFGSRWTLSAHAGVLSDGYSRGLAVQLPFFALNTPWAAGIEGTTQKSKVVMYDKGKGIFEVPYWANEVRATSAWAIKQEDDRVWRAGIALTVDDRRYGQGSLVDPLAAVLPPPLGGWRQRGPAFTLAYQQDDFHSFRNIQGMDTPEDYNLAWSGSLEWGSYLNSLGSTRTGPYLKLRAAKGWAPSDLNLTRFDGKLLLRSGGVKEDFFMLESNLATYFQFSPGYNLAAHLGVNSNHSPDPQYLLYVGGLDGLRGYPSYLHPGDANWVLSVENRFFTEHRWWELFRLGYVVFLDVGAVHQLDGKGWSPAYSDLGVGLRLGDLKSSLARVVNLTVSVPLERQPWQPAWQFGIGNLVRF